MKSLIVEDDFTSRLLLQKLLEPFGECHVAVNGREAVNACKSARDGGAPYTLVCLDIVMPGMNGQEALKTIREQEDAAGVPPGGGAKIIMTTGLQTVGDVAAAYQELCDGYLVKPIDKRKLVGLLKELALVV
jgi:two-component system, chemotaxis family, chemotaxis protein CheY